MPTPLDAPNWRKMNQEELDARRSRSRSGSRPTFVRGDIFFWDEMRLDRHIPVAIAYNLFLDRFISGITGGAVK